MNGFSVIKKPSSSVMTVCGEQAYYSYKEYRLSCLTYTLKHEDGLLMHSCMTGELVLVKDFNDAKDHLIRNWFLVPLDFDEKKQVPIIQRLLIALGKCKTNSFNSFEILTTTGCNARCFYCYEHKYEKMSMGERTAHQVARFIIDNSRGNIVHLKWYGGEPLVNIKAIDTICKDLTNEGICFTSTMISNGSLFSDKIVKKASSLWFLKKVRITIDGTESVYNAVKNYVRPGKNPYLRVLGNIDLLLSEGINVRLRLNVERHNLLDNKNLIEQLTKQYRGNSHLSFSINWLNNTEDSSSIVSQDDIRDNIYREVLLMKKTVYSKGFEVNFTHIPAMAMNFCRADAGTHILIKPNGELAFCAEDFNGISYGSIYEDASMITVPSLILDTYEKGEICDDCPLYASCILSKHCPTRLSLCNKNKKELILEELKYSILEEYRKKKEKNEIERNICKRNIW